MADREHAIKDNLNRRARQVGQVDDLTTQDIEAVIAYYDFTCLKCGKKPSKSIDHVQALMNGGANTLDNMQLLCENCNKGKGATDTDYRQGNVFPLELRPEPKTTKETYKKHDWDEIEFDFISSSDDVSLRVLSSKYSVSLSHIGLVSSRENWLKKRENFRNKLGTTALESALEEQLDLRLEISRTTLDFLKLWRRQANKIGNQDLIKLLELGARASGLELDKRSVTIKDWRDVSGTDTETLDEFATGAAEEYFSEGDSGEDRDKSAGWTD